MNNDIGIIILDAYSQKDLDNCYHSVPAKYRGAVFVVSNTKNVIPLEVAPNGRFVFDRETSFAAMANVGMAHFRTLGKKYFFFLETKMAVLAEDFFERVIETAKTFGTWCMVGPGAQPIKIHDDEKNLDISLSPEMNASFLFLYSGVIKQVGYFLESYYSDEPLYLLDYVCRLRKLGVYPESYHPCIDFGLYTADTKINKVPFKDNKTVEEQSFALFYHTHKFIPGHSDPKPISQQQLFALMQTLQQNYAQ